MVNHEEWHAFIRRSVNIWIKSQIYKIRFSYRLAEVIARKENNKLTVINLGRKEDEEDHHDKAWYT